MSSLKMCRHTNLRWKIAKRSRLVFPTCCSASIDISLHNYRCDSRFLECLLRIVKAEFKSVEISLGDCLQRFNYPIVGHPDKGIIVSGTDAYNESVLEGDKWIEKNLSIVNDVFGAGNVNIKRWSDWLVDPELSSVLSYYDSLIRNHEELWHALNKDLDRFLDFRKISCNAAQRLILAKYLIEEVSVYHIHNGRDLVAHIYAGDQLHVLKALKVNECALPSIKYHDFMYVYIRE